jgi:ABC-2 type transport system ATP-binding protein
MSKQPVITVNNVSKIYPHSIVAVDSLSLTLHQGEIFGMLGPNGAGKTTTIRMILGLTEPTSGLIDILGLDPLRRPLDVKRRVAYMPDAMGFYEDLSAYDNLDYIARFINIDHHERERRIVDAVQKMGLEDRLFDKVSTFSHGMKRRLGLAEILVRQPAIAILDEPTQGLDPHRTTEFLHMIQTLTDEGMSVLLASHHLEEVQSICDRVGLFHQGRMDLCGTIDELATQLFGGNFEIVVQIGETPDVDIAMILKDILGVSQVIKKDHGTYQITATRDVRPTVATTIVSQGCELFSMDIHRHTLHAVYQAYYQEVYHAA